MSFCKDCLTGVTHEGQPQGELTMIGGVGVYIAKPTVDYPKDKAILFLPDIFGHKLINAQLLADDFARSGFYTIIIDYFENDPVPLSAMEPNSGFDLMNDWFPRHGAEKTRPLLDAVIRELKKQGVNEFGATGYCFGARYVFDLAYDGVIKVSVVSHPSLLKIPEDLKKYADECKQPLLINSCSIDQQFPLESQAVSDEIFSDSTKARPLYKRVFFAGCTHGFAVRGDLSIAAVKSGKEGSFRSTVEWFMEHL